MNGNWLKYASNPRAFTIRKWLGELIGIKCEDYRDLTDRLGPALVTDKDVQEFGNMLSSIYEAGYLKAMLKMKDQLDEMGVHVKVVRAQSEKSGEIVEGEQESK